MRLLFCCISILACLHAVTALAAPDEQENSPGRLIGAWNPTEEQVLGQVPLGIDELPPELDPAGNSARLALSEIIDRHMHWDGSVSLAETELELRRAVVLARIIDLDTERDWCLMRLGLVHGLHDYPGSRPYVDLALAKSLAGRPSYGRCQLLGFAAQNALANADYDEAQAYALRSISDCNHLVGEGTVLDAAPLSLSYGTMISLLIELDRPAEAELLLNHVLSKISSSTQWPPGGSWWLSEAAHQYGMDDLAAALLEQFGRDDNQAWWMFSPQPGPGLALQKLRSGRLDDAVYLADMQLQARRSAADEDSCLLCGDLLSQGLVRRAQGLPADALESFSAALAIADEQSYAWLARRARREIASLAIQNNDNSVAETQLRALLATCGTTEISGALRSGLQMQLANVLEHSARDAEAGQLREAAAAHAAGSWPQADPEAMQRHLAEELSQAQLEGPLVEQLAGFLQAAEPDWQLDAPPGLATPQAALDALLARDDLSPAPEALCLILGPLGMHPAELARQDFEFRLERATAAYPDYAPLLIERAGYLAELERGAEAAAMLTQALRLQPGDPVALLQRAMLKAAAQQRWSLLADLDLALANGLEAAPRLAYDAHLQIGMHFNEDFGLIEGARQHFWLASTLRRDLADPFINLAYLHEQQGESEQAIAKYRHALDLEPDNLFSWKRLASIYYATAPGSPDYRDCMKHIEAIEATEGIV